MKKQKNPAKKDHLLRCFKKELGAWALLAPFLILLILIVWVPSIQGFIWSFFKMEGYTPSAFVGLKNYKIVIKNTDFKMVLGNTWKYVAYSVVLGYFLPIIITIAMNELTRGKSAFRFIYYLPSMIPSIASSMLWYYVYYPNENGLLNMALSFLGIAPRTWLGNPNLTILLLIVVSTWSAMGGSMLLYLAALQGVNRELYEAAIVDGAGIFSRIRHVTIPGIASVLILQLVRMIIAVFQILQEPLTMTGGGPNNASTSLGLLAYRYAFQNFQIGNAQVVNAIMFFILIIFTILYFKLQNKVDEYI